MPIRRDKVSGIWQMDLKVPGLPRLRQSTGTTDKAQAQELYDKLKAERWRQVKLDEKPDRLFEAAAKRFLQLSEGQSDYATKARHVEYWLSKFPDRTLRSLTSDEIIDALPTHSAHKMKKATPLTGTTKNRYIATIKRIFTLSVEWDWIDKAPKLPTYEEPDVRVRWEPQEVIEDLIHRLRLHWMRDATVVAVATGLRETELFSLTTGQVNLSQCTAWVTHEGAKSGYARPVPLNDDACEVLERRIRKARERSASSKALVFTRRDDLETQIRQNDRRDFARACRAVGVADFHWHDLRHTWASWHVQRGTPLMVLKELGGWETIEMVQKYAHLAPSHVAAHASAVKFWSKSGSKEKAPVARPALSA